MCHLIMHEMLFEEKSGSGNVILIQELGVILPMRALFPEKILAFQEAHLA